MSSKRLSESQRRQQNSMSKHPPVKGFKVDNSVNLLKQGGQVVRRKQQQKLKLRPGRCIMDEKIDACSNKPLVQKLDCDFSLDHLKTIAKILVLKANAMSDYVPTEGMSPGNIFAYLVRCAAKYAYNAKMLEVMPSVNADAFRLPIWVANWFEAWAPYKNAKGLTLTPHLVDLEEAAWIDSSFAPALQGSPGLTTPVAQEVDVERVFRNPPSKTIASVSSVELESINSFLGSLFATVPVESLKLTTDQSHFHLDGNRVSVGISNSISRYASPLAYHGRLFQGEPALPMVGNQDQIHVVSLGVLSDMCQQPHQNISKIFRANGVSPNVTAVHIFNIDFAVMGSIMANVLQGASLGERTDFGDIWWRNYILQVCYLMINSNPWVKALQTEMAYPTGYYVTPLMKQIATLPCFSQLQRPDWYYANSIRVAIPSFGNARTLVRTPVLTTANYNDGNTPQEQHITFATMPTYPLAVLGNLGFNALPLETLNELMNDCKEWIVLLKMRPMPGGLKKFWTVVEGAPGSEVDFSETGGYSIQSTVVQSVSSPFILTPQECFIRRSTALVRAKRLDSYYEALWSSYDSGKAVAYQAVPNDSDQVRIGQAGNQVAAATNVWLDKIMDTESLVGVTTDFAYQMASSYVGEGVMPTKEQLARLVSGKLTFDEGLSYVAGLIGNHSFKTIREIMGPTLSFRSIRLPPGILH